jgi:sugar/nucleoside kinase (ribokinase family)
MPACRKIEEDAIVLTWLDCDLGRPWRLLAYGDPNVDLMFAVDRAPASNEKVLGRRLGSFAGGTVANAACAAAALGCRTQAVGSVGDDADGAFLLDAYARHGVDSALVRRIAGAASSCAMVMLEPGGEKALVYAPVAGEVGAAPALDAALAASTLLYSMPYDIPAFVTMAASARGVGTRIAIDIETAMVRREGDAERLLGLADIVFMNDATYGALFGGAPNGEGMRRLLEHGPRLLVVTCGAAGALAASRDETAGHPAFAAALVDSTGAGDCFNGAFLAALFEGGDLPTCLRFACAAASFAVAQLGARSGIPSRARIEELLAAQPA